MIVPEQWPYHVVRIEETLPLAQRFPGDRPAAGPRRRRLGQARIRW